MCITLLRLVFLAASLLTITAAAADAQTAQVSGKVADSTGAVVPGATIVATNVDRGEDWTAVSNAQGYYTIPFLPSGRYTLRAELTGFRPASRENVVLETDRQLELDFTLTVGDLTETVDVLAAPPVLATESSSVGQVITGQLISDLPLNGRNFLQLARLATGVLESAGGDRAADGGAFVANGARSTLNSFMLDGVDNNARIVDQQNSSNVVSQPSVDALSEFSIQTNNFSAEHGQAAGAVINATIKSGTNRFRGVVFDFVRNDALDARNPFARPEEAKKLDRHQFGGTLGGPIVRNRTFFFGSLETTKEIRGVNYRVTVPDARLRSGDFSALRTIFDPATTRPNPSGSGFVRNPFPNNRIPADRIDPLARRLLELLPLPNAPGATGNYSVTRERDTLRHQIDTRIDQSFSTNSKVYVRYSLTKLDAQNPGPFDPPIIGSSFFQQARKDQTAHNVAVGHSQVLGANRVNELRLGYNRISDDLLPFVTDVTAAQFGFKGVPEVPGVTGLPRVSIGGFADLGEANFLPNFKISEVAQAGDTFSFLRGRHAIKAGANYRFIRSFFNISGTAKGFYNFGGGFTQDPQRRAGTGSGLADFMLGIPSSASLSTMLQGDIRWHYLAGFAQDDWRLTDRLTLNLGLRYELFTHPYEQNDRQANLLLDQLKLIYPNNTVPPSIPREFTTTIPDGVSPRALMRLDTNNLAPRLGFAFKASDRLVLRGGAGIFYGDHPVVGASGRLPSSPPFRQDVTYPSDLITPIITLQNGFPADALEPTFSPFLEFKAWEPDAPQAEAYHWNLTVQRELPWFVAELGYTGSHGENLSVNYNANAPLPGPGSVVSRRPFRGFGGIDAVKYESTSDYHAGHLRVERRLLDGLAVIGHYTYGKSIDLGGTNFISGDLVYRDPRNIAWERALSSFDVRHNLVVSYIWDLPIGKERRVDLGGRWLNAVLGGWQFNGLTTARSGSPFTPSLSFNPAQTGHARPDRAADGNLPRSDRTVDRWFDPSAFTAPVPFNFGNAGRNILIGPGVFNTDFGLFKRFAFNGRGRENQLQIRIEAFNVFNQPHHANPVSVVDLPGAGQILGIRGTMREMQVGVKWVF